jgi:hypothetical protein
MKYKDHYDRFFRHVLSIPFIYFMIVPSLFLDISLEIYHRICFPLYGLDYVKRSQFIKIDRHKLKKLWLLDKINCAYCGYVNGLMAYAVAVAAETEKYWCGVKHKKDEKDFHEPKHHEKFMSYEQFE